jgi:deoxycytidylate deaminase
MISPTSKYPFHPPNSIRLVDPPPCTYCSKMIINAGIKKVVASSAYPDQLGVRLMKEAGLQLVIV